MASISVSSRQQQSQSLDWARLIPGEVPTFRKFAKQPARGVKPMELENLWANWRENPSYAPKTLLPFVTPGPLQTRMAWKWLRSMAADCFLVALNWLVIGALLVLLRTRFPHVRVFETAAGTPLSFLGIALLHAALITLMAYTEGLHRCNVDLQIQVRILAKSVLWGSSILCFAYGLQGAVWAISSLICVAGLLHFGALCMWRWWSVNRDHVDTGSGKNVLIVGAGSVGRRVSAYIERHPSTERVICGFLDDEKPLGNGVIGRISDLPRIARKVFADEIILAAPRSSSLTQEVLEEARRLRLDVEIIPELFGCAAVGHETEQVGGLPVICLHQERLPAASLALKRVADVLLASLALVVLSPLMAVIAAGIKFDSSGPVFYVAQRAGRKGRLFRCYKFRTMVSDADELKTKLRQLNERSGPFFKITADPRITRLGHYLRRYSVDELPQLWNVVKGEMSLVGPRPHPVDDVAGYEIEHLARLDVAPGITGLWQVTARRDPSFDRGMQLDREYIRTWSLGLDLRILLRTTLAVLGGGGE